MYLIGSGTKRCVFTLSISMEHGWAEVVAVPGAVGSVAADATVDIA